MTPKHMHFLQKLAKAVTLVCTECKGLSKSAPAKHHLASVGFSVLSLCRMAKESPKFGQSGLQFAITSCDCAQRACLIWCSWHCHVLIAAQEQWCWAVDRFLNWNYCKPECQVVLTWHDCIRHQSLWFRSCTVDIPAHDCASKTWTLHSTCWARTIRQGNVNITHDLSAGYWSRGTDSPYSCHCALNFDGKSSECYVYNNCTTCWAKAMLCTLACVPGEAEPQLPCAQSYMPRRSQPATICPWGKTTRHKRGFLSMDNAIADRPVHFDHHGSSEQWQTWCLDPLGGASCSHHIKKTLCSKEVLITCWAMLQKIQSNPC